MNSLAGIRNARILHVRGDVSVMRGKDNSKFKPTQKTLLKTGDFIITGDKSFAIVRSKASVYKISSNSKVKLLLETPEIINSDVRFGSIVVEFFKNKLSKSIGKQLTVKSKTSVSGVRGTTFFTYVDKKTNSSTLSVMKGAVDFRGSNSKENILVGKGSSSMTNKKLRALKSRELGFESKINWNVTGKGNMNHQDGLYSAIEKTWEKHKYEQVKKWNKRSEEMENLWNQ